MGGANANSTYFYTYLDAKYVKKRTSWRTLKINNPFGLWSWDPLASSYDYGGQNLIHSAYEAREFILGRLNARNPCYFTWGFKAPSAAQILWEKSGTRCVLSRKKLRIAGRLFQS